MKLSIFIAGKIAAGTQKTFTSRIIRIASMSVTLSVAVMILAIGIVKGFQKEIKEKVSGFGGHVFIKNLDLNQSGELALFPESDSLINRLSKIKEVKSVYTICQKPGILRTLDEAEGIQCKGVPTGYCARFINQYIVRGRSLLTSDSSDANEILISEITANRLALDTGQRTELYFIQKGEVRRRKPLIVGIYSSGIFELDKNCLLTDIRMIQRIYSHGYDSVNGIEIYLNSLNNLSEKAEEIDEAIPNTLKAQSVSELYFQIFQWLGLLDMNVIIIIALMLMVSVVNMMTALLVLIIDRTPMIGILKSMGSRTSFIRRIFVYNGARYILLGLFLGNVIGLGLGMIQKRFGLIRLNEETYYLSKVPFEINFSDMILINALTFAVCFFLLTVPAMYVSRIKPIKAIRFD